MGDFGRIERKFHSHAKVKECSLAAIGLWTLCNAWSRDKRTAGFIPNDCLILDDHGVEVNELVQSGLWDSVPGGYHYHDYQDWNGDVNAGSLADRLVATLADHPTVVQQKLRDKIVELLEDGQKPEHIESALKVWAERPNNSPNFLPFLVSDAIRRGSKSELLELLRDCYRSCDVTPLRRHGYWFREPTAPLDIKTPDEMREFMKQAKRKWLAEIQETM